MTRRKRPVRRDRHLAFTARSIGSIAPESHPVDWFDQSTPGLALRVAPGGRRSWYAFYRKGKTVRRVKLGTWPAVELAKARQLARQTRVRVETTGADPAHERKTARDVFTVGNLAETYLIHAEAHKRTWKDDGWRIDRYILPPWKSRAVTDITRADAHALLDKIVNAGTPIQANRVQALISKMWNVAIDRGHATVNPCHRMAKHAAERARETVLNDDELRALWRALESRAGDAGDSIRLRLLTGQRGGEVHDMLWADVNLPGAVWTISAASSKNKRPNRVPLTKATSAILSARHDARGENEARVFPGLYHQREDLRELATIHDGAYRWHDLRRTVATRLAALGIQEETIGRLLNHAKRGVTATVYNQHQYDAEKRAALMAWERELARIVNKKARERAAVLSMRRRA